MICGVWATSAAREEFTASERDGVVDDYEQDGPQLFADGVGFAVYEFSGGRRLVVAEKSGRVSLITSEEVRAEQQRL